MKKKLGFTLVEIMIVVAIIALLTAIAIPAFLTYRRDARRSLCVNNMRNIEHAKEAFAISRNLRETTTINWENISDYIGQGIEELYCPETDGVSGVDSYVTQLGDAHPSVGNISGSNRVECPVLADFDAHVYTPGEN